MSNPNWLTRLDKFKIQKNVPLAPYTTMGVGGPADFFYCADEITELMDVLRVLQLQQIPYLVLGGGSNLVIHDKGFRGLVIYLQDAFKNIHVLEPVESDKFIEDAQLERIQFSDGHYYSSAELDWDQLAIVYAGAAAKTKAVSLFAANQGLSGLEFACGIPGTIGGALFMNAGAYDSCIANACLAGDCLSSQGEKKRFFTEMQCFSYRNSVYRQEKHLILGAYFLLQKSSSERILSKMESFNERRISTQPLDLPSSGSVFKRPEGYFAGKLIMDAGLKGKRIGGAEVSTKHAGFIVNTSNASAQDIYDLVALVRDEVKAQFDVLLEPEIRVLDEYGQNLFH